MPERLVAVRLTKTIWVEVGADEGALTERGYGAMAADFLRNGHNAPAVYVAIPRGDSFEKAEVLKVMKRKEPHLDWDERNPTWAQGED